MMPTNLNLIGGMLQEMYNFYFGLNKIAQSGERSTWDLKVRGSKCINIKKKACTDFLGDKGVFSEDFKPYFNAFGFTGDAE